MDTVVVDANDRLRKIVEELDNGQQPEKVTVRDLLAWFGAQRRGLWIVDSIRSALKKHNLVTKPDFEGAFIDQLISFEYPSPPAAEDDATPADSAELPDPTYRIGKLASANRRPVSVAPDDTLEEAITVMLLNDFSQLPVMTNERTVKGIVSWNSVGSRLALGKDCYYVRDCMEPYFEISADTSLFAAINNIVSNEYVLIRDAEQVISGIVTTSDLSVQFQQLAEPFLLIGEIENYIR